jgi:hypothetical protein
MLVVILGLLVALFVIGTSFSYITLSERRAATNYLDRQRALDLALDGVEYSIARLREEKTREHYEFLDENSAAVQDRMLNAKEYIRPLDGLDGTVSWPRSRSESSTGNDPDRNWADFDGDGSRDDDEIKGASRIFSSGGGKNSGGYASTVTGMLGEGININQVANRDVQRPGEKNYGVSGTYQELGDIFRVRVVDAASLLNINNFSPELLRRVLPVLGGAIDDWVSSGNAKGDHNPFSTEILNDFMDTFENFGGVVTNKEQLRDIWSSHRNGDYLYDLAMKFITVNSWRDNSYRGWVGANTKVNDNKTINPLGLTDQEFFREGYADNGAGKDGWPEWQPQFVTETGRSPVNINTAPYPVLVALFANMTAKAPFLYYKKEDLITQEDKLQKDVHGATVRRQISGTTEYGRQNAKATEAGTGVQFEENWRPNGAHNTAIFQLVDIGPITTLVSQERATDANANAGTEDIAVNLAMEIIKMRAQEPFQSWQDFDTRFFRQLLLKLPVDMSSSTIPDVVATNRGSIDSKGTPTPSEKLLPRAENVNHGASPFGTTDAAMSESNFKAWYWKCCVDMMRANFNPNNVTNRYNADYPYHQNVDRMDLTYSTCPLCFSSMGVFEVISQGEILAPVGDNQGHSVVGNGADSSRVMARRQIRTVVKVYDVLRHSSQRDFMTPLDPNAFKQGATSSSPMGAETLVSHTRHTTKSYPYSVNELTNGSWDASRPTTVDDQEDSKNIRYASGDTPESKWKGHAEYMKSSDHFGYIGMDPQDRTPVTQLQDGNLMTFHARFNESFNSRYFVQGKNGLMNGAVSDAPGLGDRVRGKNPVEFTALFDDFVSSATPRSKDAPTAGASSTEFKDKFDEQAGTYATLQPDGAFLHGGALRHRATLDKNSFDTRGSGRLARLKILRYPCGSHYTDRPFFPISPFNTAGALASGIDDTIQAGYAAPAANDVVNGRVRLEGTGAPYQGTDNHNKAVEGQRQLLSNMPYYEGVVDFWIKWSAPPQGAMATPARANPVTVSMGEIDPASHNFSGLFGATAYGRVSHITKGPSTQTIADINQPESDDRTAEADIEGVQFFVYKEPGGVLRFSRLYFNEAFGLKVPQGSTSSGSATITRFGSYKRIFDQTNAWGGYTASNDICPNDGSNKGFLYARTDAWVDLSDVATVQYVNGGAGEKTPKLRVHDWHRFTLEFNSSHQSLPYRLWIDGRRVGPIEFYQDPDGTLGFLNNGSHSPYTDQPVPPDDASNATVDFYRNVTKLIEINPEDRLTVGCIFRRQRDIATGTSWQTYFEELDDTATTKPSRPVFKFDSNFVAVANATIDDFRVTNQMMTTVTQDVADASVQLNSRYPSLSETQSNATVPYFEHGFLPVNSENGELHSMPVKLGTISWTEVRPDWDPYEMKGLDMATSARVRLEWAVYRDIGTLNTGGARTDDLGAQNPEFHGNTGSMTSTNPDDDKYWAKGGLYLRDAKLPAGSSVGAFIYRFYFEAPDGKDVNNVTAFLDDVTLTLLTPPRTLSFSIDY